MLGVSQGLSAVVGTYTGNSCSAIRAIAHGLGKTPKVVLILNYTDGGFGMKIYGIAALGYEQGGTSNKNAMTEMDGTSFYVGDGGNNVYTMNVNTKVYYFVAIG